MSLFKPAGPHRDVAPAVCLCRDCSRIMLDQRCPHRNRGGVRCGDYRQHRGPHTMLICTVFLIAAERVGAP